MSIGGIEARGRNKSLRVLVVDDEEVICEFLKDELEERGCIVDVAHSASKGLQTAESRQYDAAILDYLMPGGNGDIFYRHLLEKNPVLARRVLVITADPFRSPLVGFLSKNNLPFLIKPFQIETLLEMVHSLQMRHD